jgi:hypothetical protein
MARCSVDLPPKIVLQDGASDSKTSHWAACWLYDAETLQAEGRPALPLSLGVTR